MALKDVLIDDDKKKKFDGKSLGYFINIKGIDTDLNELGINYFKNVAHILCIDSPDLNRFKQFFNDILKECPIEDLFKDIPQAYHYYKANSFRINTDYPNAVKQIIKTFKYNGNDLNIKDLAQTVALQNVITENGNKKAIEIIEKCFEELPFLKNYKPLQYYYVLKHMKIIHESFNYKKINEGEKYYNKFLSGILKYDINNINDELINSGLEFMPYY